MEQFLIDTNCISDYLSALLPSNGMHFMDAVIDEVPNISIISQIELLCWNIPDKKIMESIKKFIEDCNIIDISHETILNCVKIRKGRKIKTPDAIIAATAISHGYTFITNNGKDFNNIPLLKVTNPQLM
jgi:predicted nucleic acid-binding protein